MVKVLFDCNISLDMMNDIDAASLKWTTTTTSISALSLDGSGGGSGRGWGASIRGSSRCGRHQDHSYEQNNLPPGRRIRQAKKSIKLPDAIIGATANGEDRTVVTRNPKDFGANKVRKPYRCEWDEENNTGLVSEVAPPP